MVFTLLRKTITAGEITVVRNMQTERFYNSLAVCGKILNDVFIDIAGKQHSLFLQLFAFLNRGPDVFLRKTAGEFFGNLSRVLSFLHERKHFIGHFIHQMDTSAVDIQYNVVSVILISMNQAHLCIVHPFWLVRRPANTHNKRKVRRTFPLHTKAYLPWQGNLCKKIFTHS